uniref:Uncharacterized protein n=1 Tax=Theileria annulata TaxID=5874 RepID=A0A3B0NA98_THEAN
MTSLNDSIQQSVDNDFNYLDSYNEGDKEITSQEIMLLSSNYYMNNYLSNIIYDDLSFFLFQGEVLLNLRMYTDSLSACLCFQRLGGSSIVSKCISLVAFYQMNYIKNFKYLKE